MIAIADRFNLTVTIPPGYALQNYLCSGSLKSNTNTTVHLVLDDGEHHISTGLFCTIFNEVHLAITGFSMFIVKEKGECFSSLQYER